jgi:hypothetical protein
VAKSGPPHSLASRRRDLSTKPWTGHQVEKVSFFADGNVVEIDAQIFDLGEEVDRAKSVPRPCMSASDAWRAAPISFHFQSKGGFLSLAFNLLDDF